MNARAYLAELLGTFLFFAIGMSSVQAVGVLGGAAPLLVVVPLGFGFGLLTAIFVLVVLSSTKHAASIAALAIPLALVGIRLAAVPFTGASVNPARSIAPALLGGDLSKLWIYLVAPVVGAVIAALVHRAMDRMVSVPAR